MIPGRGRADIELPRPAVELGTVAPRLEAPAALRPGQEPDAIGAVAVVEAGDGDGAVSLREPGRQLDLGERVAGRRAAQGDLERAPLLDRSGGEGPRAPAESRDDQTETPGRRLAHINSSARREAGFFLQNPASGRDDVPDAAAYLPQKPVFSEENEFLHTPSGAQRHPDGH